MSSADSGRPWEGERTHVALSRRAPRELKKRFSGAPPMHRAFALVAALLALVGPSLADTALAEDRSVDFTVTLVTTNSTPGQLFADGLGNQYWQGSSFTGQASGWPFNGTFRLDA